MRIDDLSPLQLKVFEAFKPGESLTRMELKERLNITVRSTLARIISRLEVFGILEKTEEVPERIQLTTQGEWMLQRKKKEEATFDSKVYHAIHNAIEDSDLYKDDEYKSDYSGLRKKLLEYDDSDHQLADEDCEPIDVMVKSVRNDIEWLRQLSLDVAGRVKNETDLNRISVWSRAASDLANTYSMLSYNELKEVNYGYVNSE